MRRIGLVLLAFTLIFSLVGCGKSDLEAYKEAVEKTSTIVKGQSSYEMTLEQEFNTEGLSQEEIKNINYFKNMKIRNTTRFDDSLKKVIAQNYTNFGGMGFDTEFYINGEETFIKMPIIGKYMEIDQWNVKSEGEMPEGNGFISKESIDEITEIWVNILNEEDVVSGKTTLLNTEEGEVKATLFTITLTGDQIKTLANTVIEKLESDEGLEKAMTEYIKSDGVDTSMKEMIRSVRVILERCQIKEFKYEVYIDIDGYIVQTNHNMYIEFSEAKSGEIKSQRLSFQSNNWDIEEKQEFIFPELTQENKLSLDQMEQGIPFMFEGLFENQKGGEK